MNRLFASTLVVGAAFAAAGSATAGYSITQQAAPAPTYSTVLNFDEPGAPTGFVPSNYWAGLGLASLTDGANPGVPIGNVSGSYPWVNTGNVASGFNFGLFFTWDSDVTAASFQMWTSAQSGPFGAMGVTLLDANDNIVDAYGLSGPIWGGVGNSWFNVTTSGGSAFRKLVITYGGFGFPELFVDNVSWNAVPAPGAMALLGLAAFGGRRRR